MTFRSVRLVEEVGGGLTFYKFWKARKRVFRWQAAKSTAIRPERLYFCRPAHQTTLPTIRQSEPALTGTDSYSRRSETRASVWSNLIKRDTNRPFSWCEARTIWPTRRSFALSEVSTAMI